jgi:hypothetical protein
MNKDKYVSQISHIRASEDFKTQTKQLLIEKASNKHMVFKSSTNIFKIVSIVITLCFIIGLAFLINNKIFSNPINNTQYIVSDENTKSLPQLTYYPESEGMGFEGLMAYNVDELTGGNPWNESTKLKKLPVFKNTLKSASNKINHDDLFTKELIKKSESILKAFKDEVLNIEQNDYSITLKGTHTDITTYNTGEISINFSKPISIPKKFKLSEDAKKSDYEAVLNYLIKNYKRIIDMKSPAFDIWPHYTFSGEKSWDTYIYENSGNLENQIVGYNFNRIRFGFDDSNNLHIIWLLKTDINEKIGDYPIISIEQAKQALLKGDYYTTVPEEFPGESEIEKVELIYRTQNFQDYFIPFYRFYINLPSQKLENELNTFGIYYVPAVEPSYLKPLPKVEVQFN